MIDPISCYPGLCLVFGGSLSCFINNKAMNLKKFLGGRGG